MGFYGLARWPWRPYNHDYVIGRWRGYYDFDSGATLLDWGAHTLDLCQAAVGADGTTPIEYEPIDMPNDNAIQCRYANGVKLILRRSGWLGLGSCPVRFEGDEGWVETGDTGRIAVSLDSLRAELSNLTLTGTSTQNHVRDFFNCVKSRGLTAANADVMRKSHIACHAAAIAWKLGTQAAIRSGDRDVHRRRRGQPAASPIGTPAVGRLTEYFNTDRRHRRKQTMNLFAILQNNNRSCVSLGNCPPQHCLPKTHRRVKRPNWSPC